MHDSRVLCISLKQNKNKRQKGEVIEEREENRVLRVLEFLSVLFVFLLSDVRRPRTCLRVEMIFKLAVIKYYICFSTECILARNKLAHFFSHRLV